MLTHRKLGFTFVEILIVLAIIALIATISAVAFKNMYDASALRAAGNEVYEALIDSRTKTLASNGATVYGVHVSSTTVERFTGDTYVSGDAENEVYVFEGGVTAAGTLVTSGTNVIFARLTGEPSATGTIAVRKQDGTGTTTITVHGSGLIEFE